MNWAHIQGKWQDYRGLVQRRWAELTDSDLTSIQGRRDVLVGMLVTRYGGTMEAAEKDVAAFEVSCGSCSSAKPQGDEAESTDAV